MNNGMNIAKKVYVRLSINPVRVQIESAILAGSVTDHPVQVNSVTVETYIDGGTFDITF